MKNLYFLEEAPSITQLQSKFLNFFENLKTFIQSWHHKKSEIVDTKNTSYPFSLAINEPKQTLSQKNILFYFITHKNYLIGGKPHPAIEGFSHTFFIIYDGIGADAYQKGNFADANAAKNTTRIILIDPSNLRKPYSTLRNRDVDYKEFGAVLWNIYDIVDFALGKI
jgi:hypothetical protein